MRAWPEFACYRDICYWFKYFLCPHPQLQPTYVIQQPSHAGRLTWQYEPSENALLVGGFGIRDFMSNVRYGGDMLASGHRFPSYASPFEHAKPHEVF